jgi:hypothetical protein
MYTHICVCAHARPPARYSAYDERCVWLRLKLTKDLRMVTRFWF